MALSRYQINILLCGLKFTPMLNRNIVQLKSVKVIILENCVWQNFFYSTPEKTSDKCF